MLGLYLELFFACECPVVPAAFTVKTIFAPFIAFASFLVDYVGLFWTLCSVPLVCWSVLSPIPYCCD